MNKQKDDLTRLTDKLLKNNPSLEEEFTQADQAWEIAIQISKLREQAGLTQKQLAHLVGTKQSNVARLESADYTGYTLKTLEKITKALRAKLKIRIIVSSHKYPFNP